MKITDPRTTDAVEARQADIVGRPPRIPALRSEDVLVPARKLMAKIAGTASGHGGAIPDAHIPEMLLTAMAHRDLFERLAEVSLKLLQEPALPLRDRQLVILRVGWLRQIPYIWGEHVAVSKRLGLSGDDIEQVVAGSTSPHWTGHERALLQATEELIDAAMISDAAWDVLAQRYDHAQLIELPVLVGQFCTVGYFQNALRIPLSPANQGLHSR